MNVMILLLFIGVVLVVLAVGFFIWNVTTGATQHVDRLALLPLRDDDAPRCAGTNREQRRSDNSREGSR